MPQTLDAIYSASSEIKRSRFLAFAAPYAQFETTLESCRRDHGKASHHCTAARWLDATQVVHEMAKDDGEPGGTAGRPILRVLQAGDWVNIGVVVVRYFGGIKLGTGGLARAYGGVASAALSTATGTPYVATDAATINVAFAAMDAAERFIKDAGLKVQTRRFHAGGVTLTVSGNAKSVAELRQLTRPGPYD